MGWPVPPPPPEWAGEEAKRRYVRMLEARIAAAPPTWLIVGGIVAVCVVLAGMLWSISGWAR